MASQWYYKRDGREMVGPCTSRELKQMASSGQLLPTDRVHKEGLMKPVRARRVKGLFAPATDQGKTGTP